MVPAHPIEFRVDDLSGDEVRALVTAHVASMYDHSPPGSVHALDVDALRGPGITFWSAWRGDDLVGCGALKRLDERRAEIKSMRVADGHVRQGIGRAILDHLLSEARKASFTSVWLETGTQDAYLAAREMYEKAGFTYCPPFPPYVEDPSSTFMTRELTNPGL